jgi:hypothetical protein
MDKKTEVEKYLEQSNIEQYIESSVSITIEEVKQRSEIRIRAILIYTLLTLFITSTAATFVLIYLKTFNIIHLSNGIIYALIAASIAEIVSIIILPVKYLFPVNKQ